MSNNILFVFEGEKTEQRITDSLTKYFMNENTVIQCAYCNNIYRLHRELANDDLDTFQLLKEIPKNEGILSGYTRNDFAEIYMFFDYDGHDTLASDEKVKEALTFFNEETEYGKLILSYPMVEALRHVSNSDEFKKLKVSAKRNIRYKEFVNNDTDGAWKQVSKYTNDTWLILINLHLRKMNYITNNNYTLPVKYTSQADIFSKQLEKYIRVDSTVAVLSSFPVFLFDYYGYEYISELLLK